MAAKRRTIVKQDLNIGYGETSIPTDSGGIRQASKIGMHSFTEVINVKDNGAAGDGVTDDFSAIEDLLGEVPNGGCLYFPPGNSFKTTQKLKIERSNVSLWIPSGAEILFQPSDTATHDRAISIHAGDISGFSGRRNITGAIAVGATTFTATSAGDLADVVADDWLIIEECDSGVGGEIVYIDWVQVKTTSGTTCTLWHPFRTAFPGTHSTVTFRRVQNVVENVRVFGGGMVRTTDTANVLLGISAGICRNVAIEGITSKPANGNAFYSYRGSDINFVNCFQEINIGQASEFAATVGLGLYGNTFRTIDKHDDTSAFVLDFGTAHFNAIGNKVPTSGNIGAQLAYVHHGVFADNTFGYVRDAGSTNCQGLSLIGCQSVIVSDNVLIGGAGTSTGIASADSSVLSVAIASQGNLVAFNRITGFTTDVSLTAADFYITQDGSTAGGFKMGRYLQLKHATNPFLRLSKTNATAQDWDINNSSGNFVVSDTTAGINPLTITAGTGAIELAGTGNSVTFSEITTPSAPAANKVILFSKDNGSGKTQLMALFPSGAAQQIQIEP